MSNGSALTWKSEMYKVLFQTLKKQEICNKIEKEEISTEFLTFHLANELETYSARVY